MSAVMQRLGPADVVAAIDREFPDRIGLVLRPSHAPKVDVVLGLIERVPVSELAAVPDALLTKFAEASEQLGAALRAWSAAGERERMLLGKPTFPSDPLDAVREAFAAAAAATTRQRALTTVLVRYLRELEDLHDQPFDLAQEKLYLWGDDVSAWLRREIGETNADDFESHLGALERAPVECRAFLEALRDDVARKADKYAGKPAVRPGSAGGANEGPIDLRNALQQLKEGLLTAATSGEMMPAAEYRALRRLVTANPLIGAGAPPFLKSCRSPEEFRQYMQSLGGNAERSRVITEGLGPILESLEDPAIALRPEVLELGERLGRGGFGEVFKCRHRLLEKDFAVKVFNPSFSEGEPEPLQRFFREARILFDLNHPNIVRVYDVGMFERRPFIRMEYIEGASLTELLAKGTLEPSDALGIVQPVAAALCHAHRDLRVIHRDIKPSNIMMANTGRVVLVDFGLGIYIEDEIASRITKTGERAAGGHYTAPELEADPKLLDARSDIYSLGAVWHTLLTGRPPAAGQRIEERLKGVPGMTAAYADNVRRCLDDLNGRFQGCEELLEALATLSLNGGGQRPADATLAPDRRREDSVSAEQMTVLEALRRDEVSRPPAERGSRSLLPVASAAIGSGADAVLETLYDYEFVEFTGPSFVGHLTEKGQRAVGHIHDPADAPLTGDPAELMKALLVAWRALPPRNQKEPLGLLDIATATLGLERGPGALRYLSDYGYVHWTTSSGHQGVITDRGHGGPKTTPPRTVNAVAYLGPNAISVSGQNAVTMGPGAIRIVGPAVATAPTLSAEAADLLKEGALDKDGAILMVRSFGGQTVSTNGREFGEQGNPRSEARWRAAVQSLVQHGLVEQSDSEGMVFSLTDAGYRAAEGLA